MRARRVDTADSAVTYVLYGYAVESTLPLSHLSAVSGVSADVRFEMTDQPPAPARWKTSQPVYESPFRDGDEQSRLRLYRDGDTDVLQFPGVADFYVCGNMIHCVAAPGTPPELLELRLLGVVLSLWCERRGIPVLHGCSINVNGRALLFLADRGTGKSALAAAWLKSGYAMLSDDVIPIETRHGVAVANPSFPHLRLEPDACDYFLGHEVQLPLVNAGFSKRLLAANEAEFVRFEHRSLPIGAIYVCERRGSAQTSVAAADVESLPAHQGLFSLLRHSYLSTMIEHANEQHGRMQLLASVLDRTPVLRLVYDSGFDNLDCVVGAVLRDQREPPRDGDGVD